MIKNKIILLSICLISCINSTTTEVPHSVLQNFKIRYPNSGKVKWELDKHGNYEAKFKQDNNKLRADFLPNGKWIETEQNISKKQLPEKVRGQLESIFDYEKIYEIEKVEHHLKGWFYDVEIKINGEKKDIEFNANGQILN